MSKYTLKVERDKRETVLRSTRRHLLIHLDTNENYLNRCIRLVLTSISLAMARLLIQLFALQCVLLAVVHGLFGSSSVKNAVKYQLQQKVLTLGSSYTVKDDKGNSVYKVQKLFPKKLMLHTNRGFRLDLNNLVLVNIFN